MTASPIKIVFTLVVCSLTVFNNPNAAQACWLTDWLWGNDEAYPVAPPVITTNYPAYPTVQANYQPSVVGSCPAPSPVTTVGYAPQMNYNSQYQRVPVTVYRPVPVYQPNAAGVPVVGYQGCTTSRYQVQRVPALGAAPAPSSCGCASAGYSAPIAPSTGGTITSPPPGQWVPRTDGQAVPYTQPAPQIQPPPQVQAAPATPSYGSGGSRFSQPSGAPPASQNQYSAPPTQGGQPADTRPALRPELNGPSLNGSNGVTIESSTSTQPLNRYMPQPVTSQRPAPTTVTPSSTAPAPSGQWKVTPVTPIPDPQFSNSGSTSEAPRLLDPRDKTAGLDQRSLVIPVGYEMAQQPPRRSFTPPTASIQADNDGWYSLDK